MSPSSPPPAARWIAVVAGIALVAGLVVASRQWRKPGAASSPAVPAPAPVVADLDSVDDRAVEQALRLTPRTGGTDSTAIKSRWMDQVQGFDVSHLSPKQHELFIRFANAERCTCGCGYTLAGCRSYDSECETSLPRVRALYDSVESGLITSAA